LSRPQKRWRAASLTILVIGILYGSLYTGTTVRASALQRMQQTIVPGTNLIVQQTLQNIAQNGWNPQAQVKGATTGGLYVNWQMDDPNRTNALYALTQSDTSSSHDIQTDLYHLNNLSTYTQLNPQDHSFDADRNRILPLVKYEYTNYNIPKGWVYFYLLRNALLLNDPQLLQEAYNAANNYYKNWYDASSSLVYNRSHTPGVVTVEHTITSGVALIDAGQRWNQPDWQQAGISTLNRVIACAYNAPNSLFYNTLTIQNGTLSIPSNQAKAATQGSIAEALSEAYLLTHDTQYLIVAGRVLQSLLYTSGLWDATYGGLNFAFDLNSGQLEQSYKETRAQAHTLLAIIRYNQAARMLGNAPAFLDREQQLTDLLTGPIYQSTYHGYFYRVTPDFQIYTSKAGHGIGYENFFTTEAMGLVIDALQQTERPEFTF
jgi:hypothetical protein